MYRTHIGRVVWGNSRRGVNSSNWLISNIPKDIKIILLSFWRWRNSAQFDSKIILFHAHSRSRQAEMCLVLVLNWFFAFIRIHFFLFNFFIFFKFIGSFCSLFQGPANEKKIILKILNICGQILAQPQIADLGYFAPCTYGVKRPRASMRFTI